jgi:hypothetical protein
MRIPGRLFRVWPKLIYEQAQARTEGEGKGEREDELQNPTSYGITTQVRPVPWRHNKVKDTWGVHS